MPKGREKVPKRLLTKEMINWQKAYKDARKIAKAIGMVPFAPEDVIRQSLFEVKNLLDRVPRERVKELAQQPEVPIDEEPEGEV